MNEQLLKRADAIDALRGFAVLMMILSGAIHYAVPLPAWMYHAQVPPPDFKFNPDLPGVTWVDLVFPFFLFAMGAAFPFALRKKAEKGVPAWKIVLQIVQRGVLLVWFAIFVQHVKPYTLNPSPTTLDWLTALLGFALLFPMLLRLPSTVTMPVRAGVKITGYAAAAVLLSVLTYPDGSGFSAGRSDIIIIVLANTALFGSLIWLCTKENILPRLGILGILIALRLTQSVDGSWNQWLWRLTPVPWAYTLYYLQYLFIVIPGSIAGDIMYKWIHTGENDLQAPSAVRMGTFLLLMVTIIVVTIAGLFTRQVAATAAADAVLCGIGLMLLSPGRSALERFYREMFQWGAYWLVLGLFFEAYEGGIKKDHPTLSYYFVMNGLAVTALLAFSVLTDVFRRRRLVSLLIDNGQNPMIAYVGAGAVVLPVMGLTGMDQWIAAIPPAPWVGLAKGVFITLMVALIARFFTKKKLFWRT